MDQQGFELDEKTFKTIWAQSKVLLKKNKSSQDIFNIVASSEFYLSEISAALEELTPPYYLERLNSLLAKLSEEQMTKAKQFAASGFLFLSEQGWMNSESLRKIVYCIESDDLDLIANQMQKYGMKERYPTESKIFVNHLFQLKGNMFEISMRKCISKHFHSEVAKFQQNMSEKIEITSVLNQEGFKENCFRMRIAIKQSVFDLIYEAVSKIGLNSLLVHQFLEQSTYPAFINKLWELAEKVPSRNLETIILKKLGAFYLYLNVQFYVQEIELINGIVQQYYEVPMLFRQSVKKIGLDDYPQIYQSALSELVSSIKNPEILKMMIKEIKSYNDFVFQVFLLRTFIRENKIMQFAMKKALIEAVYSKESEFDSLFNFEEARKMFLVVTAMKSPEIIKDYKRTVSLCILADYKEKTFMQMREVFERDKDDPSLYISKIFVGSSQASIPQNFQFPEFLSMDDSFLSRESIHLIDSSRQIQVSFQYTRKSAEKAERKFSGQNMTGQFIKTQIAPKIRESSENGSKQQNLFKKKNQKICFLVLIIPEKAVETIDLISVCSQDPLISFVSYQKKFQNQLFYYGFQTIEREIVDHYKIKLCYKDKEQQSQGLKSLQKKAGLWLYSHKELDGYYFNQFLLEMIRYTADISYSRKQADIKGIVMNWLLLLANHSTLKNNSNGFMKSIFDNMNVKALSSPLISLHFICYVYFVFQSQAYGILKEYSMIEKLYFVQSIAEQVSQNFPLPQDIQNLYNRLHMKKVCKKAQKLGQIEFQKLFTENLQKQPKIIRPETLNEISKLYPSVLGRMDEKIVGHMLHHDQFDVFDFILIKLEYMNGVLGNKPTSKDKYQFLKQFIEYLMKIQQKEYKSVDDNIKITCKMIADVDALIIQKSHFFSQKNCLDNQMLVQLYKRSKALSTVHPLISQSLLGKLAYRLDLKFNQDHLKSIIEVFLLKPFNKFEKKKLTKYFSEQKIPLPLFRALIQFYLDRQNDEKYEIQQFQSYLQLYVEKNKDFLHMLEEKLLFLDEKYAQEKKQQSLRLRSIKKLIEAAIRSINEFLKCKKRSDMQKQCSFLKKIGQTFQDKEFKQLLFDQIVLLEEASEPEERSSFSFFSVLGKSFKKTSHISRNTQ